MRLALVIDDSKTMRDMTTAILNSNGFETIVAVDGQDALNALSNLKDKELTIITADYNMPNMNGIEFVKAVRKMQKYEYTPILMISSDLDPLIKEQAKEARATGWVRKPFDATKLIAAVNKLCGNM
jgi:two-component system, chemotaxis family, chemotaxis protein CheY